MLTKQGYLNKTYDKSYRLLGKPAVYSLTAQGIRALRDNEVGFSELAYKNQYKNRSTSSQLVDHSLDVFKLCLQLKRQYYDKLELFSKAELTKYDQFIRPLPDLYVRKKTKEDGKHVHYQLEMLEAGILTWIVHKRLQTHQEWCEEHEEEWEDNYPTLLFVCENANTEKRVQRLVNSGYFDFGVMTTTRERLETNSAKIWLHDFDSDWDEEMVLKQL